MKEFTTSVTTVNNYEVSSRDIRDIADNIEGIIIDYIECNWHGISTATDVPLEVRQKLLLHVIKEMFNPNSDFNWLN